MTIQRLRNVVFLVMLGAGLFAQSRASAWACYKCEGDETCTETESGEWGRERCVGAPEWTSCSLSGANCMFIQ
jgi:hypothetical protein